MNSRSVTDHCTLGDILDTITSRALYNKISFVFICVVAV